MRSIIPQYVNVMALTATASRTMRRDIIQKLGMTNTKVINISPEKRNVFLAVKDKPSIENFVEKVSVILLHERQSSNIFCRKYDDCYQFYRCFQAKLGKYFTIPAGAPNLPQFRMVDMYTRCTQVAVKDHIVSEFVKEDGKLRIVIATIAFGMGIDCPNVSCVVHWGPSETVEDYVQEIGRAGRNNHAACALLFFAPCDKVHVATFMVEYSTLHSQCKRVQLFNGFDSFESDHHLEPKCTCCFVCAKACKCGSCDAFLSQFVYYEL